MVHVDSGNACKSCASRLYSYDQDMTAPTTPYSSYLGDKDPLDSIKNNIEQIQLWRDSAEFKEIRRVGEKYAKFRGFTVEGLTR